MRHFTKRQLKKKDKNLEFPPNNINNINLLCMQQIENVREESSEMKKWQNIAQSDSQA